MRDNVLWRKQSRIIILLADILKYRRDTVSLSVSERRHKKGTVSSALMQAQQYKSALEVFERVKRRVAIAGTAYPFLDANIAFCKRPLPWSNGVKDHKSGSWWQNFQLVRFGGRRQVAISQDTGVAFNSMLRMMNR